MARAAQNHGGRSCQLQIRRSLAHPVTSRSLNTRATFIVIILTACTLGLYPVYLLKRITRTINKSLSQGDRIGNGVVIINFITAHIWAGLFLAYLYYGEGHPVETYMEALGITDSAITLLWVFIIRNRLHYLFGSNREGIFWFNAFWTLLFSVFYLNYRINKQCEVEGKT
jgi:hypothetical protein